MKQMHSNPKVSRRQLLKLLSGAVLCPLPAFAQSGTDQDDYKALVYLYLAGGNDSHNMLIPTEKKQYQAYSQFRPSLAVRHQLLALPSQWVTSPEQNAYFKKHSQSDAYLSGFYELDNTTGVGLNALMPELAQLVGQKKAKLVLNSGVLPEPISKADLTSRRHVLPGFLFSHKHQKRALLSANSYHFNLPGWGGKIADKLKATRPNAISASISYAGGNRWTEGQDTRGLVLKPNAIPTLKGIGRQGSEARTMMGHFQELIEASSPWMSYLAELQNTSANEMDFLAEVWHQNNVTYRAKTSYQQPLFNLPDEHLLGMGETLSGSLTKQLEAVAKMIYLNSHKKFGDRSQSRQLFFVELPGFDHHAKQLEKHPKLLRELSLALESFDKALTELGLGQQVRTCVTSEFNRTLTSNGDGTDHAWGGHSLVLGDFKESSASVIGEFCDFELGGKQDYGKKGRFIPQISQDQISASLAYWFGVPAESLAELFVHLPNFSTTSDIRSALLPELMA